jgi:predicted dehydrogenase
MSGERIQNLLARVAELKLANQRLRRDSAPNRVRIAFVGCGNIAYSHLTAICSHQSWQFTITAAIDPSSANRDKLIRSVEDRMGNSPKPFGSLTEALTDGQLFDAVLIMVPTSDHLHEKVAVEALAANKHTLLEKPIEVTMEGAQKIMQAYKHALSNTPDLVFNVAENAGYWPEIVRAKELINAGAIGDVITCSAKFWESAMGPWAGDYLPGTWRCDDKNLPAASFTFDGATHWIRPLRMWFGKCTKVVATTGKSLSHMAGASFSHAILKVRSIVYPQYYPY